MPNDRINGSCDMACSAYDRSGAVYRWTSDADDQTGVTSDRMGGENDCTAWAYFGTANQGRYTLFMPERWNYYAGICFDGAHDKNSGTHVRTDGEYDGTGAYDRIGGHMIGLPGMSQDWLRI